MPPRNNPLKLNKLQLRTLLILQILAEELDGAPAEGDVTLPRLPQAHGDHYHIGPYTFPGQAVSGLHNIAVWKALGRKGLTAVNGPEELAAGATGPVTVTAAGRTYDTGLRHLLEEADHGEHD